MTFSKFQYILAVFLLIIVYMVYLIVKFHFEQFKIDQYMMSVQEQNREIEIRNKRKENTEKYIQTNAYLSQVAKATQNRILPGEVLINIVEKADIDGNADIDSQEIFANTEEKSKIDPTANMTNLQKWQYLFKNGIRIP